MHLKIFSKNSFPWNNNCCNLCKQQNVLSIEHVNPILREKNGNIIYIYIYIYIRYSLDIYFQITTTK